MATPNAPSTGPQKAPPEVTEQISKLNETIERLEAKFPNHGARTRAAADLPATAANDICKQECITINEEYGELVRARVERFMLSGKVKELEQLFKDAKFTGTNAATILEAMKLFHPDKKGHSNITQKFRHGNKEVSRVRVAVLDTHLKKLQGMQSVLPEQMQFHQNLIASLEELMAMDPLAAQLLEAREIQDKPSKTEKALKPHLRLVAMLIAAGASILSLISKQGRPSLPFALYAGLTFLLYNGGLPKGKQAALNKQLEFLPDSDEQHAALGQLRPLCEKWYIQLVEDYEIKGEGWKKIMEKLMSRSGRDMLKKARSVLLNKKTSKEDKKKKVDELIKSFAPKEDNAAHQSLRKLIANQKDFTKFSYLILEVRSREAQHIFLENIKHGMGPHMWKNLDTGTTKPQRMVG